MPGGCGAHRRDTHQGARRLTGGPQLFLVVNPALTAISLLTRRHVNILTGQLMPVSAMIRPNSLSGRRIASQVVLPHRHRFQVCRVDATNDSAQMVQCKVVRNRSDREFVDESVGKLHLSVDADSAIASGVLAAGPEPARPKSRDGNRTIFFDACPHTFNRMRLAFRGWIGLVKARSAAVVTFTDGYSRLPRSEHHSTIQTRSLYRAPVVVFLPHAGPPLHCGF